MNFICDECNGGKHVTATTSSTGPTPEPTATVNTAVGRVVDPKRGDHYGRMIVQPIDFIVPNRLDFLSGNVIKYVARGALGDDAEMRITDLRKAAHYLGMLIQREVNALGREVS